jgi:hypothetical protein
MGTVPDGPVRRCDEGKCPPQARCVNIAPYSEPVCASLILPLSLDEVSEGPKCVPQAPACPWPWTCGVTKDGHRCLGVGRFPDAPQPAP